jgi:hypothetical protein
MIVLLDIEKQNINVYGANGITVLPFSQAQKLYSVIDSDTVYYVTNAMEVNVADILSLLKNMGVEVKESAPLSLSSTRYVHAVKDGTVYIDDSLKFEGKFDCKPYTDELSKIIKQNPTLQKLLEIKAIEVISEHRRQALMQEFKTVLQKQKKMQKKADKRLDQMLLTTKVKDFDGEPGGEDIEEIDITSEVQRGDTSTEEEKLMRAIGKKI